VRSRIVIVMEAIPCVSGHGEVTDEVRVDGIRLVVAHHAAGLVIDRHSHDTAKLAILIEGGATERIGADVVEHGAYEVIARPPYRPHENQYHAAGARSIVVELESPVRFAIGRLAPEHGRRIVAAVRAPRAERARAVRAAIADTATALAQARPRATPAWLEHAREELLAELVAPPTIAELARRVGVHPIHLAQAFHRRWNLTPGRYVRSHRVFRAVELIARGLGLAQVASEVGFADQSHMTRAIRDARKAAPRALRALLHEPRS
jgi:AraC family transcriptional regulator